MDLETLVHRAQAGDVQAFVELTRGYQHLAFGSALALVHDLQQAEDVVQEAFLAAWSTLPKLAEPAAFPAWLRSIVRHQAYRVLRRRRSTRPWRSRATRRRPIADSNSAERPRRRWLGF
jgi:RNA polymerase sigma-70 factor, ECF subfamily